MNFRVIMMTLARICYTYSQGHKTLESIKPLQFIFPSPERQPGPGNRKQPTSSCEERTYRKHIRKQIQPNNFIWTLQRRIFFYFFHSFFAFQEKENKFNFHENYTTKSLGVNSNFSFFFFTAQRHQQQQELHNNNKNYNKRVYTYLHFIIIVKLLFLGAFLPESMPFGLFVDSFMFPEAEIVIINTICISFN